MANITATTTCPGGPFMANITAATTGPGGPYMVTITGPGPFVGAINGPPGPVIGRTSFSARIHWTSNVILTPNIVILVAFLLCEITQVMIMTEITTFWVKITSLI